MRSYKYDKRIIFNIDDNGDNFESFNSSVDFIKQNFVVDIIKYYPGGWDTSYFYFRIDGIELKLIFRDFGGTELNVSENLSESDLSKVRQLAIDIYNFIHNNGDNVL